MNLQGSCSGMDSFALFALSGLRPGFCLGCSPFLLSGGKHLPNDGKPLENCTHKRLLRGQKCAAIKESLPISLRLRLGFSEFRSNSWIFP